MKTNAKMKNHVEVKRGATLARHFVNVSARRLSERGRRVFRRSEDVPFNEKLHCGCMESWSAAGRPTLTVAGSSFMNRRTPQKAISSPDGETPLSLSS